MKVLLDIEWIEKDNKYLSQLSAVRVDNDWNTVDSINVLVQVPEICLNDVTHVALGGISPDEFRNGISEEECMAKFADWHKKSDTIWVWSISNSMFFSELWERYLPFLNKPYVKYKGFNRKTDDIIENDRQGNPYTILEKFDIEPPCPQHRSESDIEAMRLLFRQLCAYSEVKERIEAEYTQKHEVTLEERNREIIDKTEYNYIFSNESLYFHRKDCPLCLKYDTINGSVYYSTAMIRFIPCELCKPVPLPDENLIDRDNINEERQLPEYIAHAFQDCSVVGWCKYRQHPGAIKTKNIKSHMCIEKECFYFIKNNDALYWKRLEEDRRQKELIKIKVREQKAKEAVDEERCQMLRDSWQTILDDMESDMYIVRISRVAEASYKILYVSDNGFADGNRYIDFLQVLGLVHPNYRIRLFHIKDLDGKFVTSLEYFTRYNGKRA